MKISVRLTREKPREGREESILSPGYSDGAMEDDPRNAPLEHGGTQVDPHFYHCWGFELRSLYSHGVGFTL